MFNKEKAELRKKNLPICHFSAHVFLINFIHACFLQRNASPTLSTVNYREDVSVTQLVVTDKTIVVMVLKSLNQDCVVQVT